VLRTRKNVRSQFVHFRTQPQEQTRAFAGGVCVDRQDRIVPRLQRLHASEDSVATTPQGVLIVEPHCRHLRGDAVVQGAANRGYEAPLSDQRPNRVAWHERRVTFV
jgi:hypothetical protein